MASSNAKPHRMARLRRLWVFLGVVAFLSGGFWFLTSRPISWSLRGRRPGTSPAGRTAGLSDLAFALYTQPSAYHGDFWEHLDLFRCEKDFERLRQDGFNGLAVSIPFGAFIRRVTPASIEMDEGNRKRLVDFLAVARRFHLTTVLWFTMHRLPDGVSGTAVADYIDPSGIRHAAFVGYFPDDAAIKFQGDYRWQAYLAFCRQIAVLTRDFDVVLDPLDWQNFEPYVFQYGNPRLAEGWRRYLQGIEPDLAHWRARWSEGLEDWSQVLPPLSEGMLEQLRQIRAHTEYAIRTDLKAEEAYQLYALQPVTDPGSAKWSDFADWRDRLLNEIYAEITAALRPYHSAPIGQRLDMEKRYGRLRQNTWGVAPNIDVLFYPMEFPLYDADRAHTAIRHLTKQSGKPLMLWEITLTAPKSRQALWEQARNRARAWRCGLGLWCWRDSYFNYHTDYDNGLRRVDGARKEDAAAFDFISEFYAAAIDPPDGAFDTPSGKGAFLSDGVCGVTSLPAIYTVAPTRLVFSLPTIAPGSEMQFHVALLSAVGDGAEARIVIETARGRTVVYRQYFMPYAQKADCQWIRGKIPLEAYQGQAVRIRLEADGGPANDLTGDWIAWAAPVIVRTSR